MRIFTLVVVQCLAVCCVLAAQQPPPFAPRPPVQQDWRDPAFIGELQLSETQVNQIEQSIGAYRREMVDLNAELKKRGDLLGNLILEDPVDEAKLLNQRDLVAETRAAQDKAGFLLQLAIRKICSSKAQWARLMTRMMPVLGPSRSGLEIGVKTPRAIVQPMPGYTDEARARRIQGIILLQVLVHKDGTATVSKILKGLGYGLDQSATETIEKRWRFEPGSVYGEPVEVSAHIEVSFRLY